MHKLYIITFFLIFTLCLTGCANKEVYNIKRINKLILGEWNWLNTKKTSPGGASLITSPRSENKTRKYRFTETGECYFFENEVLLNTYNYSVIDIDVVRGENKKDIWLKLTDPISGNVLPQSTFIRITTQFLYIDRELDFIEETYEKL